MARGFVRAIVATALFAHTCVIVFVDLLRLDCDETSMDTFSSGGRGRRKPALATNASTSRIDVDLGMRFPASLGRQPFDLASRRACEAEICERHMVMGGILR